MSERHEIVVVDVNEADEVARSDEFCEWLREHDVNPNDTYRVEVEGRRMAVHQYAVDEDGKKFVRRSIDAPGIGHVGDAALREPFIVDVKRSLPVPARVIFGRKEAV